MRQTPEELFVRYAGAVRSFLALQVRARDLDDCVSEVFLQAIVFRSVITSPPLSWLLERAVEVARASGLGAAHASLEHALGRAIEEKLPVQQDSELLEVAEVLRSFSVEEREVLGCALAGLNHQEAARVVGCTPGAYRVRLHRARGRLKQEITGRSAGRFVALFVLTGGAKHYFHRYRRISTGRFHS